MTITTTITKVPIDTKVADFLHNYAGYSFVDAMNYVQSDPGGSRELAQKMKKSIMDDKSITKAYKDKIEL